jgi:hypothetical protein
MPQRVRVERAGHRAAGEQRLDLRGEQEARAVAVKEQRLLAHVVLAQQQRAVAGVPDGEGEHAPQVADAVLAVLLVEVQDDFHVGAGAEAVARREQPLAQLGAVVDLAVADQRDVAGLVEDRLGAALEIDDAQAAEAERDAVC